MSDDTTRELLRRIVPEVTDAVLERVEAMEPVEAFAQGAAVAALSLIESHQRERRAIARFINALEGERQ